MTDFDNAALTSVQDPDASDVLAFEVGGITVGWRADGLALKRASDRGVEVGEVLQSLARLDEAQDLMGELEDADDEAEAEALTEQLEETGLSMAAFLEVVATIVWVGALRINEDVRRDAILSLMDMETVAELPLEVMLDRLVPEVEDEMDSSGKGKREPSAT